MRSPTVNSEDAPPRVGVSDCTHNTAGGVLAPSLCFLTADMGTVTVSLRAPAAMPSL